jgi:hypothetical protein
MNRTGKVVDRKPEPTFPDSLPQTLRLVPNATQAPHEEPFYSQDCGGEGIAPREFPLPVKDTGWTTK